MALSITNVSPSEGRTGGRELIVIQGTDFNIAVNTDGSSKMEVYFGSEQATRVRVRKATELDCLTPIHDPAQVDVKVKDTVSTDEDTLTDGFEFKRPEIGGATYQTDLWYVIRAMALELKRQIIEEVVIGAEVDWSYLGAGDDQVQWVELAKVPCLVLDGPRIIGSTGPLRRVGEDWEEVSPGLWRKIRTQEVVNLEFTLIGVDDHKIRLTNLLRECVHFFTRNTHLKVLKDPSNPGLGYVEIDMRPPLEQDWRTVNSGQKSSLKSFSGPFTLWGVPIGPDDYWDESWGITDPNLITERL